MVGPKRVEFPPSELNLLWYLKRKGGSVSRKSKAGSLYAQLAYETQQAIGTIRYATKVLESKSLVIRTHLHGSEHRFGQQGNNPLVKLEMVDPNMYLPAAPHLPLAVVLDKENQELEDRTAHEPSESDVFMALVDRIHELQAQLDNVCDRLVKSDEKVHTLEKEAARKERPRREHLSQPVRDALPPDTWKRLEGR